MKKCRFLERWMPLAARLACLCLCLSALSLEAKTVAWYRFDDQEPLTSTSSGTAVTNCVANTYPAYPYTITRQTYDASPDAAYLPTYTNSAPAGYAVYDPVTSMRHPNRGCLHFHTTGSADTKGSLLRIDEDAALEAITNLTLEAFVRIPQENPISTSYMLPVILKEYQPAQATWGIQIFESCLFARLSLRDENNEEYAVQGGNGNSTNINDGRWHHLAIVYDFADQEARYYVDYVKLGRVSFIKNNRRAIGFKHSTTAAHSVTIGGNSLHNTRRFNGEIDEVRISDEVLPPEKFLRYVPMREVDADTAFYLPFDNGTGDWFSAKASPINAATNAAGTVACLTSSGVDAPEISDDVLGGAVRSGIHAADGFDNSASIHLHTDDSTDVHKGTLFKLYDPDATIPSSDYTFEVFLKADRPVTTPAQPNQNAGSFCIFYSNYLKFLICGTPGWNGETLVRFMYDKDGTTMMDDHRVAQRLDDGAWHHVALVFHHDELKMQYFVDYMHKVTFDVPGHNRTGNIHISGEWGSDFQAFPGCLDELRITRRALRPTEFLTMDACVGATLAHADFEDGLDMSPATRLIGPGAASARTGGNVPVRSPLVPGRVALDGVAAQDVRANTRSIALDGGKVGWTETELLNKTSFTLEFFARFTGLDRMANIIRLTQGSAADGNSIWGLYTEDETGMGKDLNIGVSSNDDKKYYRLYTSDVGICDGKWHHWALVFDATSGTTTDFTLYRDYTVLASKVFPFVMYYPDGSHTLTIGGTTQNPAHIRGNVDELRFTDGVLPVGSFLRALPNGTIVLFR